MGRFVAVESPPPQDSVTATPDGGGALPPQAPASNPAERIVKYMPVEVVSGYLIVMGLVTAVPDGTLRQVAAWLTFVVGLAATPAYLIYVQKATPAQMPQVWIATIAFPLWAYVAGGGPFALAPLDAYYQPAFGSVLVGLYTYLVGLFYVPKEKGGT